MVAIEEVDWSTAFDEEPGYAALENKDGLGSFDWSMEDDEDLVVEEESTGTDSDKEPVLYAMVATSPSKSTATEVCSKCEKVHLNLLKEYETERDKARQARLEVVGYQIDLRVLRS